MIVDRYIESGDFNGLYVRSGLLRTRQIKHLHRLVTDGLVQVVGDQDYPNFHIRPWASRRSIEEQLLDIASIESGGEFCLYPTPKAMLGRSEVESWPDEPYRRRLGEGHAALDLAYFTVDVIEQYRNDPRYHYWFGDVEVHFGIGDEAYLNEEERESDKIPSLRVGFAYDTTTIQSEQVNAFRLCLSL